MAQPALNPYNENWRNVVGEGDVRFGFPIGVDTAGYDPLNMPLPTQSSSDPDYLMGNPAAGPSAMPSEDPATVSCASGCGTTPTVPAADPALNGAMLDQVARNFSTLVSRVPGVSGDPDVTPVPERTLLGVRLGVWLVAAGAGLIVYLAVRGG